MDVFLQWLAVNTVIDNWDAYGGMPHNYYLYSTAERKGQLRWITWDHNFAFGAAPGMGGRGFPGGPRGGGALFPARGGGAPNAPPDFQAGGFQAFGGPGGRGFGGPGGRGGRDVLHQQVGDQWPLIRRLLDDDVYAARYRAALERALGGLLAPATFERRARELHTLVASAVLAERLTHTTISSGEAFKTALDGPDGLIGRLKARQDMVRTAIAEPPKR